VRRFFWLLIVGACHIAGCSDAIAPATEQQDVPDEGALRTLLGSVIVSNPLGSSLDRSAHGGALSLDAASAADIVYVSVPPGSLGDATWAVLRNRRTDVRSTIGIVAGGFDPITMSASVGDTIDFDISQKSGDSSRYFVSVPVRRPLIVVRTDPPPRKRDVPLNARIKIVFSEPIDPGTLGPQSVELAANGVTTSGTLSLSTDGLKLEFVPDSLLQPSTDYRLTISAGIAGVDGEAMQSAVNVDFTTQSAAGALVLEVAPGGSTVITDSVLSRVSLRVRVLRHGAPSAGDTVAWSVLAGAASMSFQQTTTNAFGVASNHVTLDSSEPDWVYVEVSHVGASGSPLNFAIRSTAGKTVRLEKGDYGDSRDLQLTLTNVSFQPFRVLGYDSHGNSTRDVAQVTWSVVSGAGTIVPVAPTEAIVTPHRDGPIVVSASVEGLPPITFTGYAAAARVLTMGSGDGHCEEGSFVPSTIYVAAGRAVGWEVCDDGLIDNWVQVNGEWIWAYEHNVTFEDGTVVWASTQADWRPQLRVFTSPGTYRFRCTLHSTGFDASAGETGVVIVQ
jgi:plastocyanin